MITHFTVQGHVRLAKPQGEDADKLSFTKGDIMAVKEQINEEWLICVHVPH